MQPYKCPVCVGKTVVPKDFYPSSLNPDINPLYEKCRSCEGSGVVYSKDSIQKINDFYVPNKQNDVSWKFWMDDPIISKIDYVPCTCPKLGPGEVYIGDNLCSRHKSSVISCNDLDVKLTTAVSAMFCEHANECPLTCPCPSGCYCKTHTCKGVKDVYSGEF